MDQISRVYGRRSANACFASLRAHGGNAPCRDRMAGLDEWNDAVGLPTLRRQSDRPAG